MPLLAARLHHNPTIIGYISHDLPMADEQAIGLLDAIRFGACSEAKAKGYCKSVVLNDRS